MIDKGFQKQNKFKEHSSDISSIIRARQEIENMRRKTK